MANKNTQNDWDENINTQETPDIRAKISTAEDEVFLRDLFGVSLPENADDPALAAKIAHRVVTVIDQTRTRIDRNQLQTLLQHNIDDGLSRARLEFRTLRPNSPGPVLDAQRMKNIRAVVEAIRESIPSAAMNEVLRYGLPSVVSADQNIPPHILQLQCDIGGPAYIGPKRTVQIDTRHQFWREQVFENRDALRDRLRLQPTLSAIGIRVIGSPPVPENYRLLDADIDSLLRETSSVIDLNRRYDDIETSTNVGGRNINIRINTAGILRLRDTAGALVASYSTIAQLITALQTTAPGIWNFISMDPAPNPVPPALITTIATQIFNSLGVLPGSGPLAVENRNLFQLQSQISEQHRFHTALREGSDNQMGAAFASSILMKYKDIRNTMSLGNETQINTELALERNRKGLLDAMKVVEGMPFSPIFDWGTANTTRLNAAAAITTISAGLAGTVTVPLGGQTFTVTGNSNAERSAGMQWVNQRVEEANKVVTESSRLANALIVIGHRIFAINPGARALLNPYIDPATWPPPPAVTPPPTPIHANFSNTLNITSLLDQIRNHSDLSLKTEEDHKKKIDELKATLEKIRKGDIPKGDKAQFLVIKKYLIEYQGMTDDEATRGANVIRGRSQLDTETVEYINYISDSLHGSYEEDEVTDDTILGHPERDITRMQNVAREAHIPLNANRYPAWGTARNYKDLMGAYFALRKMRDGSGVPWMMRLNNTAVVRRELREITRAILQNHLKAMLQDFGSGLNISDDEQKLILKDPTKPEHSDTLMQMLSGEIPPQHQATVEKILSRADKRTFRYRRNAGNALFGENWGAITGNKLGVSGKNLLYGNKHWSVVGGATGAKNLTVKTTKGLWAKKAPIAKIAALSMLGGPLGLAIGVGLFGKEFSKAKASGSVGSSH